MDLESLYERKRSLESRIDNYFGNDPNPHTGDRGYQDLLEQLDDVESEINELENGNDE